VMTDALARSWASQGGGAVVWDAAQISKSAPAEAAETCPWPYPVVDVVPGAAENACEDECWFDADVSSNAWKHVDVDV
jgi:hypothetical protein